MMNAENTLPAFSSTYCINKLTRYNYIWATFVWTSPISMVSGRQHRKTCSSCCYLVFLFKVTDSTSHF